MAETLNMTADSVAIAGPRGEKRIRKATLMEVPKHELDALEAALLQRGAELGVDIWVSWDFMAGWLIISWEPANASKR